MKQKIEPNNKQLVRKKPLLSIFFVFLLPLILAKIMLNQGISGKIITKGGELIRPITGYQQLNLTNPKPESWQLVYVTLDSCELPCKNSLYNIQQVWQALGAEMPRVKLIVKGKSHAAFSSKDIQWKLFHVEEKENISWVDFAGEVLIVDPQGNFVMRYLFDDNKQQSLAEAGNMLKDIKRLLKLSRIG
ncbi:MAG: hypothetical protein QF552_04295 [Litorilituus sp.]|jgi:hypothetical protein|nr:hypothetical protein [Litorilituus sp.]